MLQRCCGLCRVEDVELVGEMLRGRSGCGVSTMRSVTGGGCLVSRGRTGICEMPGEKKLPGICEITGVAVSLADGLEARRCNSVSLFLILFSFTQCQHPRIRVVSVFSVEINELSALEVCRCVCR